MADLLVGIDQIRPQYIEHGENVNEASGRQPASSGDGNGPLAKYVKWRTAHAPGMPGTFSPPPRVSDPDMHHGTCVTHVPWCMPGSLASGLRWSRWRGKRSRHSRHLRNPPFYISDKRPIHQSLTDNGVKRLRWIGHYFVRSVNDIRNDPTTSWRNDMETLPRLLILCAGECHRWIPLAKTSDAELWFFCLICTWTHGWSNNRDAGDFGTSIRSLWRHCNALRVEGKLRCIVTLMWRHDVDWITHEITDLNSVKICILFWFENFE